jgi:hypothetical protein
MPHNISSVDLESRHLVYERSNASDPDLERSMELIAWSIPLLRKAIEEAIGIYHFVEEHIDIEEVGIMPVYRQEGYWAVPDARARKLYLLRYQVSLFSSATEKFRQLKTRLLEAIETSQVHRSREALKLEVLEKYHDLPNPAMYMCETDLDFPYESTILPVAKRKLMTHLDA